MNGEVVTILIVNYLSILNSRETFRPWYSGVLRSIVNENSTLRPINSFDYHQDPYNTYPLIQRKQSGLANFSDLLSRVCEESFAKSENHHEREIIHVNPDNEFNVQDNGYNLKIDPQLSLIKGTLKKKFEKITELSFIPSGTKRVRGKLIDSNLQEAR